MAFDPTGFSISTSDRDGRAVIVVRGELDLATAPELDAAVTEALDAGQDVVVDLRELAFMDSTGLRVLVAAHARVERADAGPSFLVVRPLPGAPIQRILAISGVESVLDLVDDI
jgi:anti-sigma B factor antagonist